MKNRRQFIKQFASGVFAFGAASSLMARTLDFVPFKGSELEFNNIEQT
jgi:hypothetical protein